MAATDRFGPTSESPAGFRAPEGVAAIQQLAAVTAELSAAETMDSVVEVAVVHLRNAVRAAVSVLLLVEDSVLVPTGHAGIDQAKMDRWSRLPIDGDNPASEAFRTGRPVVAVSPADVRARYPEMAADTPAQRSVVCLPLNTGDDAIGAIGAIGLTFEQNWRPGPAELDFMMIFADTCAQSIRRVRATAAATKSAAQLRFLANASQELASSLDYSATLTNVARLAVPEFADWCAVDLEVNGSPSTLAVAHVDPAKVAWAWELREQYPPEPNESNGTVRVMRTGRSELFAVTDEMLVAGARDDEHLRLARGLNLRSVLIVALRAGRDPIGVMTFVRTDSSPPYTPDDLATAEDLARRAATAIENSRLHQHAASVALQFQHAALPQNLHSIDGWQIATHYRPTEQAEVGGDFFDAIAHPDGRLSVFIGDVVGHGVPAAATMAQMRSAIRAFLTVDPEPAVVVGKLDHMFEALGIAPFVTLVYLVLDPDGAIRLTNAGHYPPLVVGPSGPARYLTGARRPPVGVRPAAATVVTGRLEADETLLLFTDGLIERRDESLDVSLATLAGDAPVLAHETLTAGLAQLIAASGRTGPTDDDIAAIAIRRAPTDPTDGS